MISSSPYVAMPSTWKHSVFAMLGLIGLAFLAYFPALHNGFYNDDALFLNHAARVLEAPLALFSERPLGYLRPAWSAWVSSLYACFGTAPAGYYVAGILLHASTAFLLFAIARKLIQDEVASFAAAAAFCVCFAHSEATLWIAAHNSSLVCFFALAALLAHLRACESNRLRDGLVTAACVVLLLLAKEPGIVATAWLPLAEWRTRGFKACFERRALGRYALVAAAVVVYLAVNHRLLEDAFASADGGGARELRSTLGFVSLERILGASPWMWSATRFIGEDLRPWLGVAMFALPIAFAGLCARKRLPDALLAIAILVIAMAPSCSTRQVQFNGSRLYYFPTAGAALLLGVVVASVRQCADSRGRRPLFDGVLFVAAATFVGNHVAAIHHRNAIDYGPISRAQTQLARNLPKVIAKVDAPVVYLIEPWLDNEMHAREFFELFAGVAHDRVKRIDLKRGESSAWFDRQIATGRNAVFDCDAAGNLFPATTIPNSRNSAQDQPRTTDTGVVSPIVRLMAVRR